jgi:hypothetical protein
MRSGSFGFDLGASSGATSTTNSTMSSPTGSGHNNFVNVNGMQMKRPPQPNVLKVKNELVRKRSRDSIKTMLPGDNLSSKASAPSPKKSYSDAHFVSSLKCKPDPDVHPSRTNSGTGPSIVFRSQVYNPATDCYTVLAMPGPLHGLPDDLGAGMGLGLDAGQDFYFPSGAFPDDPYGAFPGHLGCYSNDTDLTNPSGYHAQLSCSLGGLMDPDFVDDTDLMNMLGTLDWNEPIPGAGAAESGGSTCNNSRPLSPYTDTTSSVSSARPNPAPRATAVAAASFTSATGKAPSSVPPAPAQPAALSSTAVGIADTGNCSAEDGPVHKKHRVAFSNVLEELELVSQAVRGNAAGAADGGADHISLFNLFQRDGAQSIGRLPPLRTLVEQARERSNKAKSAHASASAPASAPVVASTTAGSANTTSATAAAPAVSTGIDFDDHEFDFSNFMDEDFHTHSMDCGGGVIPLSHTAPAASSSTAPRGPSPAGMFPDANNILDASGGVNPGDALLNLNMVPSISAPNTAGNTPTVVQRKRGRPRKYSLTNPSAPVGTPSAATVKSLLPPLGQTNQGYAVPVNATVAQAYNFAVNSALSGNNGGEPFVPFASRSTSGDYGCSAQLSSLRVASHSGDQPSFVPSSLYNSSSADIRLGMTRTMSSESDTMLAAQFDLRLYDSADMGMGMLEDFE